MHKVYYAPWEPGGSYHIYNRAVSLNRLFTSRRDVYKFREKLRRKLLPFFEIYALGCVGNHFHLHGRVRSLAQIRAYLHAQPSLLRRQQRFLDGELGFQEFMGDVFARTFNAYAKAFNQFHGRTGTLFNQTVRRLRVRNDLLSRRLIAYIHCNEIKHGISDMVMGLGHKTTFYELCNQRSRLCAVDLVLERFGGRDAFIAYHRAYKSKRLNALRRFDESRAFGYATPRARPAWAA